MTCVPGARGWLAFAALALVIGAAPSAGASAQVPPGAPPGPLLTFLPFLPSPVPTIPSSGSGASPTAGGASPGAPPSASPAASPSASP